MPQFDRKPSQLSGGRDRVQHRPSINLIPLFLALALLATLITAACAGVNDSGSTDEARLTKEARLNEPPPTTGSPGTPGSPESDGGNLAATGQQLYTSLGCQGCHSIDGSQSIGPTWQGIIGRETPLEDGSTVTADEAYIIESIHDPQAKIHEGFNTVPMPSFAQLSDDEIQAIIAFMKTLN